MDYAAEIQRMRDELPEEEREGDIGKLLGYFLERNTPATLWSCHKAFSNVGEVRTMGDHIRTIEDILEEDGKKAIVSAVNYQKKHATAMLDHCLDRFGYSLPELYKQIEESKPTDHQKTKDAIRNAVKDFQKKESAKGITATVYESAFVALIQYLKLYVAWKTISRASNLIQDNPNDFRTINSKLQRMREMVTDLMATCENDPRNRNLALKMGRINYHFNSTVSKMSNQRIMINGQIQRVDLMADYTVVDGLFNLITTGTQGFQLFHAWNHLTSFTRGLALTSIAVFTSLAAANAGAYILSQKTLKTLRRDLHEAVCLQNMLQDLFEQAGQAYDEVVEKR